MTVASTIDNIYIHTYLLVSKVSPEGEDREPLAGVGVVSEQRPHHGGPHEPGHVGRGVGDREHEAGVVGSQVQYAGD